MSADQFPELSDDDIKQMARDAERENVRLDPGHRKPKGWHYRRAAILLGYVPLADMSVGEVTWHLQEATRRAKG